METSTIIGISVGGGVAFLLAIVILVYCVCCKHRSNDKDLKTQRDSSGSGYVPSDAMTSTLPKVGSNGLWIPSQSMLAATPSTAYVQAKPHGKQQQRDVLYRATSEPRMVDGQDAGRGYQGNLRIYHSQQMAPLYEVYEPGRYDRHMGMIPSKSSLYDDDRMYHSQSMLIENGYQPKHVYEKDVRDGRPRAHVRRSASDVTSASERPKQRGIRGVPEDRGHAYQDKKFTAVVEVHQHRQVPVRSYWGPNRGPNKERQAERQRSRPISDTMDYIQENTLTRQNNISSNQYPGSAHTWDPAMGYHTTASTATTTIYTPETGDSQTASNSATAYQNPIDENFKLELMTSYSSHSSSKPASVDQGVQVNPGETDLPASIDNTVSSKHTDLDEDGGYFTSSGRTVLTYSKENKLNTPLPHQDIDVASDVTDLASKGKHVTAEAFQFLDTYLSDDEQGMAVG